MTNLEKAQNASFPKKLAIYASMSGPGWVQAAVTLGGGSLVGALYLGVIGGYEFLWLQPLAMLCGIIMLAAISYVTLSTTERPFRTVKNKISPSLAWGWLIATVIADTVFCAAQFSLGTGAIQGNLGFTTLNPYVITASLFIISLSLIAISQKEGKASRIIDNVLKGLVAIIVLAFMAVVVTLIAKDAVNLSQIFTGLIPNPAALFHPTDQIQTAINATGDNASYWTEYVTAQQRDKIITAFGTAVGINMTFLLPYSLKKKGWDRPHRELSRYDLALGLFIPFILGASALVIASAASFHAQHKDILTENGQPKPEMAGIYNEVLDKRISNTDKEFADQVKKEKSLIADIEKWEKQGGSANEILTAQAELATLTPIIAEKRASVPLADRQLSAMLSNRKATNLAESLKPFLGDNAQIIFGIGVLAMAISTMLVHMMMNGYAISEAVNKVGSAKVFMIGALMPALAGLFSPALWSGASKTAMAIPASVIATTLLPIAYLAFILLMNSKTALGNELPKRRLLINILMILSAGIATFASLWALSGKGTPGILGMIALTILAIVGITGFKKRNTIA